MKTYDHYAETQDLAEMLAKENLNEDAACLMKKMNEGATGTEIFMTLRWRLENLLNDDKCSGIAKTKAKRLYEELDKALKY